MTPLNGRSSSSHTQVDGSEKLLLGCSFSRRLSLPMRQVSQVLPAPARQARTNWWVAAWSQVTSPLLLTEATPGGFPNSSPAHRSSELRLPERWMPTSGLPPSPSATASWSKAFWGSGTYVDSQLTPASKRGLCSPNAGFSALGYMSAIERLSLGLS